MAYHGYAAPTAAAAAAGTLPQTTTTEWLRARRPSTNGYRNNRRTGRPCDGRRTVPNQENNDEAKAV